MHPRYDAYNNELELKEAADALVVHALVKNFILSCSLDCDYFAYTEIINEEGVVFKGYLMLKLEGGYYSLYERKTKKFKEGKPAKTTHGTSCPQRFVDVTEHYLAIGVDKPRFLTSKKSSVLMIFDSEDQLTIKKFIKEKRLDLDFSKNLINLVSFAGTLR